MTRRYRQVTWIYFGGIIHIFNVKSSVDYMKGKERWTDENDKGSILETLGKCVDYARTAYCLPCL